MRNKTRFIVTLFLSVMLVFGSTAMAFQDLQGDPGEAQINVLKENRIINGISGSLFDPQGTISYAQAVQMIVKGFDLNIDHLRFIKEPKASDYYTNISDDAWYAKAFIIAQHHGLSIPQDVYPHSALTKEMYADLLYRALETKGPFPMIKIYIPIADQEEIEDNRMGSIQALLILKITELDEEGRFHPKSEITRSEAAVWLYQAIEFVKERAGDNDHSDEHPATDVSLNIEPVNENINKVTLAWGEKPNGCYSISIRKIEFEADEAIVYYKLNTPDPTASCIQVITYPQASTYIDSKYDIRIEASEKDRPVLTPIPPSIPRLPLPMIR